MGLGRMTYSEATASADKLGAIAADLDTELTNLRNEILGMDEVLKSEGANQLLETYDNLDKELIKCPPKIVEFEKYLRDAIEEYKQDDQTLIEEGK